MPAHFMIQLTCPEHVKPFDGRDLQGASLYLINILDPELADQFHDPKRRSAWSVSLWAHTSQHIVLRLGVVQDNAVDVLTRALITTPALDSLKLGAMNLPVERVALGPEPSGRVAVQELGARFETTKRLALKLKSPTFFRASGPDRPRVARLTPSPERILGSLQRHAYALGLDLPGEYCEEPWIFISELRCMLRSKSASLHFKGHRGGQKYHGCVGQLVWQLVAPTPSIHRYLAALIELGRFTGLGSRVAMGMGALEITSTHPKPRRVKDQK